MVNMIIDGKHVSAEENITIMEAAERNGIPIPKLCYLKGINEIAACRVCVVELEGKEKLITSCNNVVKDGMVIYTNTGKLKKYRKLILTGVAVMQLDKLIVASAKAYAIIKKANHDCK